MSDVIVLSILVMWFMYIGFASGLFGFTVKIGIHEQMNKFPHILWRYVWPKLLNGITRKPEDIWIYKWLWFYISFKRDI